MDFERITNDKIFDFTRESHEYRYELAGKYTKEEDIVLDVACGTGYGKKFLKGKYIGVDRELLCDNIVADLNTWTPDIEFDVAVSFETIEHLENYLNLVEILKKAKKYIVVSAPIIPTKDRNHFHLQDFTHNELKDLFKDYGEVIHEEKQDISDKKKDVYGILVIKRYDNNLN